MLYYISIIVFLSILIQINTQNKTDTAIFIKYNHAEANMEPSNLEPLTTTNKPVTTTIDTTTSTLEVTPEVEDVPETIVFVPNDRPVIRNEDYSDSGIRIKDLMVMRSVGDVIDNVQGQIHVETESPPEDIVFISGKNNDQLLEESPQKTRTEDASRRSGTVMEIVEKMERVKLNCTDLECNNTIKSVCGGKMEHNAWRYRLFLNDCYFRKVNCNFKYHINRFKQVPLEKCSNMGAHEITFSFKPKPFIMKKPEKIDNARRSSSSRRSLTMDVNGQFCSHPCPISCPTDYDPECAVSATGQKRVFVNHCKLDFNSCSYGVVWHRRPLAECVGGIKADMRQNRGFIGWMQRVGIVDKKGRLKWHSNE